MSVSDGRLSWAGPGRADFVRAEEMFDQALELAGRLADRDVAVSILQKRALHDLGWCRFERLTGEDLSLATSLAASRPSRIAQTMRLCPRRMSPAAKTPTAAQALWSQAQQ